MMPTADLADTIRRSLDIELSVVDHEQFAHGRAGLVDRLTAILVARIETAEAQFTTLYGPEARRTQRTRNQLLEMLRVERHQPVPRRPEQRAVRANPDTPDVIAERRALLEQIPADEEPSGLVSMQPPSGLVAIDPIRLTLHVEAD